MSFALDGKLAHGDHLVLTWMADHITVRQASAGNIELDEAQSAEKSDGTVALIMALDWSIRMATRLASRCMTSVGCCLFSVAWVEKRSDSVSSHAEHTVASAVYEGGFDKKHEHG